MRQKSINIYEAPIWEASSFLRSCIWENLSINCCHGKSVFSPLEASDPFVCSCTSFGACLIFIKSLNELTWLTYKRNIKIHKEIDVRRAMLPLCLPDCLPGYASIFTFPRYKKIHEIHTADIKDRFLLFSIFYVSVQWRGLIVKSLYVRFALEVTWKKTTTLTQDCEKWSCNWMHNSIKKK